MYVQVCPCTKVNDQCERKPRPGRPVSTLFRIPLRGEGRKRERMEYAVSAGQTKERSLAGSSQNCVNLQFTTVGYRLNRAGWSKTEGAQSGIC